MNSYHHAEKAMLAAWWAEQEGFTNLSQAFVSIAEELREDLVGELEADQDLSRARLTTEFA